MKASAFCYFILTLFAFLSFGSVLIHTGAQIIDKSTQGTAYVKQMSQDWDRQAYTDVVVTDADDCPLDTTELYENIWYG